MFLAYQLAFLHSVHIVVCGCTQRTQVSFSVSAACSAGQCGHACCPCLTGRDCRRTYLCVISTVIFTSRKQKMDLAGLLFVVLFRAVGNKRSRETEGQILHPFTPLPDHRLDFRCEGLEGILDTTEFPLSGDTQNSVFFIQHPFLLIIKEFRRKLSSSLEVFVLLNKHAVWKCSVLKDTFISNGLCWKQTQRKITVV